MMEYISKCRQVAGLLVLSCGLSLLSACAAIPSEQVVEERATARWNVLLGGDYLGAYQFLSPGFRSSVSSNQYQRSLLTKRVQWTAARFVGSDCAENTCKVEISLDYTLYGAVPGVKSFDGTKTIEESWVLLEGNWYFVPEK